LHSISTGYAGFLGALMHFEYGYPFILTEHGIYIRERRIDLLNQWCGLEREPNYINTETQEYLTNMWIRFFEVLGKIAYVAASPIISLFEAYQKEQIDNGAKNENTIVIPNGVSVEHHSAPPRDHINAINPVIALIGRVVPIKDIKTFIKSMIVVIDAIPNAQAWIIGPTNEDQEYFEECKEFVKILGLAVNIQFLGQQKINDFLPKIDLLTLSSISEGLPLVLLEGFSAGIPAITTDVGACRELIYGKSKEDRALGESGSVVEIANPTALGKEILNFLQDVPRWKKAQIAALERVKRYYSQTQVLENYINVYEKAFQSWQG
jgi:glycosyltransferase involved in cell wall biosynthesis